MLDLLIAAGFIAAAIALGARAKRGGMTDYILAARALTLPQFVATLVPTFYGGILGVGEFTWTSGLSNWTTQALPYYFFAGIYAIFLAERVRLAPGLTIADHLESAYGRRLALWGALLVFLLASPADELLMSGDLLSHLSHFSLGAATFAAAIGVVALLWRGGLAADVRANKLQIVMMFAGFALIIPFSLRALHGGAPLAARLPAAHLTWTGGLGGWRILSWWIIASWTIVDPTFHQRCAAATTPKTARRGILIAIAFWAVFDVMTTAAGLYARALAPNLARPTLAYLTLADSVLPPIVRGLFYAGVASSVFAGLQAKMLMSAISLGHDFADRARAPVDNSTRLRAGLIIAAIFAILLARLIPSVVGLWYAVGGAVIPGLLFPIIGVYRPRWTIHPNWALAASLTGFACAAAAVGFQLRTGNAPLGIEPPVIGILASGMIWLIGRYRIVAQQAPIKIPHAPQ